MYGKSNMETYITMCKIDSQWEFAVWFRKLKQRLSINLERFDGEGDGREFQKGGIYVYLWLIHVEVWQKATKFCKAIILQWKKKRCGKNANISHKVLWGNLPQTIKLITLLFLYEIFIIENKVNVSLCVVLPK